MSVDDTQAKLKPYVAKMNMNYLVLQGLDHDDLQDAYGPLFGIPVTIVISRDGKMCAKHVGLSSKDRFEAEIKSLLQYDRPMLKGLRTRAAQGSRVSFASAEGSPVTVVVDQSRRRVRCRCTSGLPMFDRESLRPPTRIGRRRRKS